MLHCEPEVWMQQSLGVTHSQRTLFASHEHSLQTLIFIDVLYIGICICAGTVFGRSWEHGRLCIQL